MPHQRFATELDKKIDVLTLFAFGKENWKRPSKEVRNLFRLFYLALRKQLNRLHQDNIKLRIIGNKTVFPASLVKAITEAEKRTARNEGLVLNIAVNYSGRWDILNAMHQAIAAKQQAQGDAFSLTEAEFSEALSLEGYPEPDLLIRTGGVKRISNFMLWELAYTELYFTQTLWPDFTPDAFSAALREYSQCERRFGLTREQLG